MVLSFTEPPVTVNILGRDYKINTDFRVWIEIERVLAYSDFSPHEKLAKCLCLAYPKLPPDPGAALEELLRFYSSDSESKYDGNSHHTSSAPPLYSLTADAPYIFGAFMECYGIDLCTAELHWWKFRALLACLDENCKFSRIVAYRSADLQDISDPKQKQFCLRMKKMYALPDTRTDEEKEAALNESISQLF